MNQEQNVAIEEEVVDTNDIEIIDDTPEQDRGRSRRSEDKEAEIPDDEEIANYSESVQGRIKKLRFEFHEERRRKEEAERVREQAVEDLKKVYNENQQLKQTLSKGEGVLVNQAKSRVEAELEKTKSAYKQAYESGDSDAMVSANERLATLASEKVRYDAYKPKPVPEATQFDDTKYQTPAPKAELDPRTKRWAEDNDDWFQKDKAMTGFAYGVHEELLGQGVTPDQDEYYNVIDAKMRETFPQRFGQQRSVDSIVAPATRTTRATTQKRLTKSQANLAKRLGLTNEQYWAQLQKEQR